MKLEANIEAVILRQSAQLQMKVLTRPGALVGLIELVKVSVGVTSLEGGGERGRVRSW